MIQVVIRTDASIHLGLGHIMRCLTLADALRKKGANIHFVCREFPGHMGARIISENYFLHLLPSATKEVDMLPIATKKPPHSGILGESWSTDLQQTQVSLVNNKFDWLIVDHYALDSRWETGMRSICNEIMVIDDLADRMHDCDLLLDPTYSRHDSEYHHWTSNDCELMTGSAYALLRPEFAYLRDCSLDRRKNISLNHILITMGGADSKNITGAILETLLQSKLPVACCITVVLGATAQWIDSIKEQISTLPWTVILRTDVRDMAQLMSDSDLCIGAAGGTSWERCCLGLATIMLVLADNQREIAKGLKDKGAVILLEKLSKLPDCINMFVKSTIQLEQMGKIASNIVDGKGTDRVVKKLLKQEYLI